MDEKSLTSKSSPFFLSSKQLQKLTALSNLQGSDLNETLDRALQSATDRIREKAVKSTQIKTYSYNRQIDVSRHFDAKRLRDLLRSLAAGANSALGVDSLLTAFLRQFYLSHESIALLIRAEILESYRGANHISDACSLVREQIEKPFYVALLCSDFEKWSVILAQDSVRKKYENVVIEAVEFKDIPDRQSWYSTTGPTAFKSLAITCGLSEQQLDSIQTHTLCKIQGIPTDKAALDLLPPSVPDLASIRSIVSASSTGKHLGSSLDLLFRWHAHYSQYAHALEEKVFASSSGRARNYGSTQATEACERLVSQALSVSFACSIFGFSIPFEEMKDAEMVGRLYEGWVIAKDQSYLGCALWDEFASRPFGSLFVKT